jgi:hypothetical protein
MRAHNESTMSLGALLAALLLVACARPGSSGDGSGAPGGSGPPPPGSGDGSGVPGQNSEPPLASGELRQIDFGEAEKASIGDVSVFQRRGTIDLVGGEGQVIVTLSGPSAQHVDEFAKAARFQFELGERVEPGPPDTPNEETLSQAAILGEPDSESVLVEFQLSEPTYKEHPVGNLTATIDPTVYQGKYNNYSAKNPSSDNVKVTITTKLGKVEAKIWLGCKNLKTITRSAPATSSSSMSGSGSPYLDLTVKGMNTGDNKYAVTGSWNYDYEKWIASSPDMSIPCATGP